MGDTTPSSHDPSDLNRAGRRAEARKTRLRKTGAAMATIPAALGATALAIGATAGPAGAAEHTVTTLDPSGAGSLHDVAEAAGNGDVIVFQSGLTGTIFLDDEINIDTSVTIQGPGAGVVTVSGDTGNNGSLDVQIFDIEGPGPANLDVVITGLTLTKGTATRGGAIDFDYANLTVRDAVITGNSVTSNGGGISSDADSGETLSIERTQITGNTAGSDGGGVYFYVEDGVFEMTDSTVSGNSAGGNGGGLWIGAEQGTEPIASITITNSTISGNTGENGGGLYAYYVDGPVTITNTVISGNTAADDGGGGLDFQYITGDISITGSTISGNSSAGYGGGIYFDDANGSTTISFTTIADNTAGEGGGGIEWYDSEGNLVIQNSTLSGNTAAEYGGGLYIDEGTGPVEIYNSTLSGNTAGADGGAIWFASYYGLTLVQTTITGNVGSTVGGVLIWDGSAHEGAAATSAKEAEKDAQRAENLAEKNADRAEKGEGPVTPRAVRERSTVRATAFESVISSGTIIAGNSGADVGSDGTLEASGSMIGTISGTTLVDQGGNQFAVNPLLGPLADNGGPTQTHELLAGSPAINAGPNPLTPFPGSDFDQRGDGYARVVAGVVDVGAYEVQPVQIEPTFTG